MTNCRKTYRGLFIFICMTCTALLPACSELAEDSSTRPRRAVESPLSHSSPNSEALGRPLGAVEIVRVDLPNRKDEDPQFHSIAESLGMLAQTAPATQKAPANPQAQPVSVPAANAPIIIVQKKNAADTLVPTMADEKVSILVISDSGIGNAVIERVGDTWPTTISFRFSHGPRPFARLEGFTANELTAAGTKIPLRAETNRDAATATISIPAFVRSQRISIEWVNEYR